MNILKNKWFILGNILLLLAIIPITLYVVKRQTNLRSKAAPTTNLSFSPTSTTVEVGQSATLSVSVDPGSNVVSIVEFTISADPDVVTLVSFEPNSTAFPVKLKGPTINTDGTLNVSLSTSNDVQKAIQTTTKVGTLTIKGKAATSGAPALIKFDKTTSQAFSLATSDGATENVLNDTGTAAVTVTDASASATPSPLLTPSVSPIITLTPSPTGSPSAGIGTNPICTNFSTDKDITGVAPYSLVFTTEGNSQTSTISTATFNFGDGENQIASESGGLGTNAVNIQIAHTYNNPGTYTATTILTDANGLTSDTAVCTKTITVSDALALASPSPTSADLTTPTLPVTGTLETTFAILGIVGTIVGVGLFIFVL